jgi:hypothetical protein
MRAVVIPEMVGMAGVVDIEQATSVRAIAGHDFGEPRRESMIEMNQLLLSSTHTRVAQPQS